MSNEFPTPVWGSYPVTPYYYTRNMTQGQQYDCDPTGQMADLGTMNVLCSDFENDGSWVADNKYLCNHSNKDGATVDDPTEITCSVAVCADLQQKYCQNGPVSLFDNDGETLIGICMHEDGDRNCVATANDLEARPEDTDSQSDSVTKWYIGDESYVLGYSYQCTSDKDSVSDYNNALCLDDGTFSEDIHVYCSADEAAQKGLSETVTSPFCGATVCTDITDVNICTDGVDLYTIDRTDPDAPVAVFSATCKVDDDGTGCQDINGSDATTASNATSIAANIAAAAVVVYTLL